jgi:hypothetical protein
VPMTDAEIIATGEEMAAKGLPVTPWGMRNYLLKERGHGGSPKVIKRVWDAYLAARAADVPPPPPPTLMSVPPTVAAVYDEATTGVEKLLADAVAQTLQRIVSLAVV